MIVSCPSCAVRFNVNDASLATGPRRVKCGRCGHVWRVAAPTVGSSTARPAPEPIMTPRPAAAAARAGTPGIVPEPRPAARPAPPVAPARAERSRSSLWVWWLLLLLLIGGIAAGGYFFRGQIVAAWPPSERLYQWIGVPLPRVEIIERTEQESDEDGTARLIVGGVLANNAERELPVPPLVFTLYDARGEPVNQWREPPPVSVLSPGETVPFTSTVGISSGEGAARPHWEVMLLRDEADAAAPSTTAPDAADEDAADDGAQEQQ